MDEETSAFRMFDVVDGDIIRRQTAFGEGSGEGERREDLYMACALEPIPCKTRGPQAKAGVRHTYWTKPEHEERDSPQRASNNPPRSARTAFIPPAIIEAAGAAGSRSASSIPHKGVRPAITITLDEASFPPRARWASSQGKRTSPSCSRPPINEACSNASKAPQRPPPNVSP